MLAESPIFPIPRVRFVDKWGLKVINNKDFFSILLRYQVILVVITTVGKIHPNLNPAGPAPPHAQPLTKTQQEIHLILLLKRNVFVQVTLLEHVLEQW